MATGTYTIGQLQKESGVSARSLRHWIRLKLVPKPIGRGRGARYDDRHLIRARVIAHLRASRMKIAAIRVRVGSRSDEELLRLLPPPPRATTPDGVPAPPPEPTYPYNTLEVVLLMDGLLLMVDPSKGPVLRRIADDIYRHYGPPPARTAR